MKKIIQRLSLLLVVVVFIAGCGQEKPGLECSFVEIDFSKVAQITLFNGENGQKTQITAVDDVAAICKSLQTVSGTNGTSGKGYYGFSYSLMMYDAAGNELYHITFSDGAFFYGNDFGDGSPTRYELTAPTANDVENFFGQYFETSE